MAWIESHTVAIRHRKLRAMAADLRIKPVYLLGHLHALWHTALEQQEDGDMSEWSDAMIADAAAFLGDAKKFVSLLQTHRWLGYFNEAGFIIAGTEKLIHDWTDYAGKFLTGRYSTSNRDRLLEIWRKHRREYGRNTAAKSEREVSEKDSTTPNPPTHPPNPTHLTNLPNPTPEKSGSGSNGVGNGQGRVGPDPKVAAEIERLRAQDQAGNLGGAVRQAAVTGLLQQIGLHPPVVATLAMRNDVTIERVEKVWREVQNDPSASDKQGVLAHRLRGKTGSRK